MNFYGYSMRLIKDEDTAMVQAMLQNKLPELEKLFGKIDIPKICEISLFSLVAFSADNKLVGFAAFDENPMATLPPGFSRDLADKAGRWAVQSALDVGYRREMLLWITLCANVASKGEDEDVLHKAMLSAVLVVSTDTMAIFETSAFRFGCIPTFLKPVAYYQKEDFTLSVCACRRSFFFPRLTMRRAREEDQDDLTPVIEHAQQRGLPLTQLPESTCPSKPYAIARLIAAQTKQSNVFVAQVGKRIMGVIALTSDVHLPSLHANYDLDCFEGLMSRTVERRLTVIVKKKKDKFFVDPLAVVGAESEEDKSEEPAAPAVEYLIQWPDNVFRVTMLCMEVEYESRAIDVINFAFSKLNKEFCLVTLPYVSTYHPLLHHFYRVPGRLNANNQDAELSADTRCLYLLNADALSPGFAVRPLQPEDRGSLEELLDNFADRDRLMQAAFSPPEGRLNMVALLSNHIVGFAMLDNTAPVADISSHFDLQSLINLQHHPFNCHATMVLYVLNPVYKHRSRLFLHEILRQTKKSIVYCPVFPRMELPDILDDLILVSGRQHAYMTPSSHWTVPPPPEEPPDLAVEGPASPRQSKIESEGSSTEKTEMFSGLGRSSSHVVLGTDQEALKVSLEALLEKKKNSVGQDEEKRDVLNESQRATLDSSSSSLSAQDGLKENKISSTDRKDHDVSTLQDDQKHGNETSQIGDNVFSKDQTTHGPGAQKEIVSGAGEMVKSTSRPTEVQVQVQVPKDDSTDVLKGKVITPGTNGQQPAPPVSAVENRPNESVTSETKEGKADPTTTSADPEKNAGSSGQTKHDAPPGPDGQNTNAMPAAGGENTPAGDVPVDAAVTDKNAKSADQRTQQDDLATGAPERDGTAAAAPRRDENGEENLPIEDHGKLPPAAPAAADGDRTSASSDEEQPAQMDLEVPETPPPGHRGYYYGFDCALYVLTRKHLYRYKTVINARIVVVGSSVTTAAFLHTLLASHELQFTNLVMISDAGFKSLSSASLSSLPSMGPKHSFPKLGLDCQVKLIVAKVRVINRKAHTIRLSTGKDIPYDWLVLSSGLQDQTKQKLGAHSRKNVRGVVRAEELVANAPEIVKNVTAAAASAAGHHGPTTPAQAPVIVYGATLEAFGAVQALLQQGFKGRDMLLVHPDTVNVEAASAKHLGDSEISQMILATLIQLGVSIHSGLKLVSVGKNFINKWISDVEFQDLVEEEALDGMSLVYTSMEKRATQVLQPLVAVEGLLRAPKCPIHRVLMGDKEAIKDILDAEKPSRPERKLKLPCSLLVTCDRRQVDRRLFRAMHKASFTNVSLPGIHNRTLAVTAK